MLDNIVSILHQECKLNVSNLLLVGVSGGADSLCMLHLLNKLGYPIIAAHVNHSLRLEADEELNIVKEFTHLMGVDFISTRMDVLAYASENSVSLEEAARIMRYQYLFRQAKDKGASAVLVAHNADDQIETILMHLLRGSGMSGLRGMEYRTLPNPWSQHIPLVRPLLSTWREDILKYLEKNQLNPIVDRSNQDTKFFRNRLRHELLPTLESYNPRIRENLLRVGQIISDDYSVIQRLVSDAWYASLIEKVPGHIAFRLSVFLEQSISIQRYLLRKAIGYYLPGLRDVDFDCVERGLRFLSEAKPYARADLMAGLFIIKDKELFWLTTEPNNLLSSDYPEIRPGIQLTLNISSTLYLNNGWQLQAEEVPDPVLGFQDSNANLDPFQTWVDAGEIDLPMIVRSRKPGERFRPLGMNGHSMKVSDIMINQKLPKSARTSWPLICGGAEILWIPGLRRSHLALIKPSSRLIVHLTLCRSLTT